MTESLAPQWVNGKAQMYRCVGTTMTGRQCKTSALYNCPKCDAFLCTWHVHWVKDDQNVWHGAHCPWCRDEDIKFVKMEGRSMGGWLKRLKRGLYQAKSEEELQREDMDRQ